MVLSCFNIVGIHYESSFLRRIQNSPWFLERQNYFDKHMHVATLCSTPFLTTFRHHGVASKYMFSKTSRRPNHHEIILIHMCVDYFLALSIYLEFLPTNHPCFMIISEANIFRFCWQPLGSRNSLEIYISVQSSCGVRWAPLGFVLAPCCHPCGSKITNGLLSENLLRSTRVSLQHSFFSLAYD